ncbi:MAG TPA: universal stress protein [Solirubrobacterales bacterium]
MQRIVVGFDGSDEARDALALGERLARLEGTGLTVAAVGLFEPQVSTAVERRAATANLRELFAEVREELGPARPFESRIVEGLPAARGLISVASEEEADLIVVGSTHRGRIGRVFPGSVGTQLLHGASCPVAVAPRGFRDAERSVRGVIGVAYDASPESELALAEACRLARVLEVSVRLITVLPEAGLAAVDPAARAERSGRRERTQERLDRALESVAGVIDAETQVIEGDPGPALVDDCEELDLIVLGSRGRGPLQRTLLGTVSARVCSSSECPVVIVPRGAKTGAEALATVGAKKGGDR